MPLARVSPPNTAPTIAWTPSRPLHLLAAGDVHVWAYHLDIAPSRRAMLEPLLSKDERARAQRFMFARDRERYVVGRATLRCILALYRHDDPGSLRFEYGAHGKPALAASDHGGWPRFNLAHCEGLALCAITDDAEIGVDLERVVDLPDAETIARDYFSPSERAALTALSPGEGATGFFNGWTRKEAYLKAVGDGLAAPLDRFDVTLAPTDEPRILQIEGSSSEAERWTLHTLEPADGFVGAIATAAPVHRVHSAWWT